MATIPPLIKAIFAEADRLWPERNKASDGSIGDARHAATTNDHNPDSRGIVHAVDITHDPAHGFDAWGAAQMIAMRCKVGDERRVKYLVSCNPRFGLRRRPQDVVASPNSGWNWRKNGSGTAHASHLHISIKYEQWVEQSTAPIFIVNPTEPEEDDVPAPNDVVGALVTAHGEWQVQHDGGVRTIRGVFHGSYPGLPPAAKQGTRHFTAIVERPDGKPGYVLVANTGQRYQFP